MMAISTPVTNYPSDPHAVLSGETDWVYIDTDPNGLYVYFSQSGFRIYGFDDEGNDQTSNEYRYARLTPTAGMNMWQFGDWDSDIFTPAPEYAAAG